MSKSDPLSQAQCLNIPEVKFIDEVTGFLDLRLNTQASQYSAHQALRRLKKGDTVTTDAHHLLKTSHWTRQVVKAMVGKDQIEGATGKREGFGGSTHRLHGKAE